MPHAILHIDASAREADSITRVLSQKVVEAFPQATILRRDLADAPLPQIDETWVGATFTPPEQRTEDHRAALRLSDTLVDELESADTIVIGTPIYNFSVPAALKLWIDQVARVGRTFEYTAEGPNGLLKGKKVVIAIAAGGTVIGSQIDFATPYLKHFMGFLGLTDVTVVTQDDVAGFIARAA
ncbi:MAG: NAD(P)H-dependent oxidoreductase [Pseudomonadota bacterium]